MPKIVIFLYLNTMLVHRVLKSAVMQAIKCLKRGEKTVCDSSYLSDLPMMDNKA
jgi:hypothetical protein